MLPTTNPFMAKYCYNLLMAKQAGNDVDRIGSTLFNSKITLTPHQIESALFAFKSPLTKGTILADEVGLGKTIEAGIVLAQMWSEHKRKILVVAPASLMRQWAGELQDKFNLPSIIIDRKTYNVLRKSGEKNPFCLKDTIIICSYQMCAASEADIVSAGFDLVIVDEAHKLRNVWTGKNVTSMGIKRALAGSKKLLLTATPIQNNVMDIYGLSEIIDDGIFGDSQIYREKYYRNYTENLQELRQRLSAFVHRTLREQVQPYIKFTKRLPKTYNFAQTPAEIRVYNSIRELLLSSGEESYLIPKRQKHLLLLILCKLMGSSIHSIVFTLEKMKDRLVNLLNSGVDADLDIVTEEEIEDAEIDELEPDDDEPLVIDKEKLKAEINNLTNIINEAKSVKIESKYIALREAIDAGFEHLKSLGAEEKILIFTESRRTQEYVYKSLIADGYEGVLQFNGSNNDAKANEIYEEWCALPENKEKLNNSRSVNMRQAIIDRFRTNGKILIATGAGAEGLNIQFCSMVVNYDLPWNPQLVEQRIGRCHRLGQKHDVAVINFLSASNVVEQRIYELLSIKFQVFNEVFGSSDAILGQLEDGIDLQNSIVEIYTSCRTTEEINAAFDRIQEQYKDVIDESMRKTKQDLLDNFDEDLQSYFADVLDMANKSVDKYELLFWRLSKLLLPMQDVDEEHRSFRYNGLRYCMSTKNDGQGIDYNMHSQLGSTVMDAAALIAKDSGHIDFDISHYPFKITNIEELRGKSGYIIFSKLTISSFENEERIFFNGMLDDGTPLEEDTIFKLFRLETAESDVDDIPADIKSVLLADAKMHGDKILLESEEKNNQILNDEIQKINRWADDKIESTQLDVEMMRNERKNLQKQSDLAESTYEREKIEEEILRLSKKIRMAWINLAEAEEDIEQQRKQMINRLRSQMMRSSSLDTLFVVSFSVV